MEEGVDRSCVEVRRCGFPKTAVFYTRVIFLSASGFVTTLVSGNELASGGVLAGESGPALAREGGTGVRKSIYPPVRKVKSLVKGGVCGESWNVLRVLVCM